MIRFYKKLLMDSYNYWHNSLAGELIYWHFANLQWFFEFGKLLHTKNCRTQYLATIQYFISAKSSNLCKKPNEPIDKWVSLHYCPDVMSLFAKHGSLKKMNIFYRVSKLFVTIFSMSVYRYVGRCGSWVVPRVNASSRSPQQSSADPWPGTRFPARERPHCV